MTGPLYSFLRRVKSKGRLRQETIEIGSMGRKRFFRAFDVSGDTFIIEEGLAKYYCDRPSVLITPKSSLRRGGTGWVMTISSGNHSTAAFPLLDGRFWRLSSIPSEKRSSVLMEEILCANIVEGRLELSQRDVSSQRLEKADQWLIEKLRLPMNAIVFIDRNLHTLEHYRSLGQDWRVKPLAWTEKEMRVALGASRRRISSAIVYYHTARGIHFLSFSEFNRFAELASTDLKAFKIALHELVGVFEGNKVSFMRLHRHRGHHEIELFGLMRGVSHENIVPMLESLAEDIALDRVNRLDTVQRIQEIVAIYEKLLTRPELAEENSPAFIETMYMYITGEVYAVAGEVSTPAFDDRRTALPGASFKANKPKYHPGADARTKMLLSNLKDLLSKDETIEYANVYELRGEEGEDVPIGMGTTREIAFKTNRRPLEKALVEKALSKCARGYAGYMLSRVEGFKALGVALAEYKILRRSAGRSGKLVDFYIRTRCEGEPIDSIPAHYYLNQEDSNTEDTNIVIEMAQLIGDAAAQNMVMKKYDPATGEPVFGVGKEIYEFSYDIARHRHIPRAVSICSLRCSFGWDDLSTTDDNFAALTSYYLRHYAKALSAFAAKHTVSIEVLADKFLDGFAARTEAMEWHRSVLADKFNSFQPKLPSQYAFDAKWRFAMWSLERQKRELPMISSLFKTFLLKRKSK